MSASLIRIRPETLPMEPPTMDPAETLEPHTMEVVPTPGPVRTPEPERDRGAVKSPAADHRQSIRKTVEVDVDFCSEHNFYNGFSENISVGGIFIVTYDLRALGERVSVKFRLPDSMIAVEVECEVRWLRPFNDATPETPPGMGLRFLDLAPQDLVRIDEFVHEREPLFFDDEG
jgi:uncharacterized protein (TIGR02266 family)